MDYRTFGRTGLRVSVCGLGGGGESRLGLKKGSTEDEAIAVVRRGVDLGINYFDTAPNYGTEDVIGRALAGCRDDVAISSKTVARRADGSPVSGADVRRALDETLRKLRSDVVDVYHLHRVQPDDYGYAAAEIVPELLALRAEGKIRFLGISESTGSDARHAMLSRAVADDVWDVVMTGFTFFNQSARDVLFPATIAKDIAVEIMASARSYFSRPEQLAAEIARLADAGVIGRDDVDPADPLRFLADGGVRSLTEASYRFVAHEPGVHVVLVGTGSPAHLEENARALSSGPLPPEVSKRLVSLFGHLSMAVDAPWRKPPAAHAPSQDTSTTGSGEDLQ
jgi:aryl-alcohol dehydrogenase-like predicted oxidoreductase